MRPGGGSAPDALIGRILDGRFRIVAPIARGGMGAVYKAEQAPLGRLVALKIMSPRNDEQGNAEFRRRFFLEASTAAKLTHPNTVRVFDYGQTEDGFFFIAMELLEGRTLKQVISQEGGLEPARASEIAKQVCRSLREAHRMGIVHRDIKPGNIMLVERGGEELAKVLDFGLAKDTSAQPTDPDDATQTGVFLGSPKYVSPEQVQGESLDARSDVYSLGVVLYEMLTGAPPFAFEQPMQVLMAHVRDAPADLAAPAGKPPIPPELAQVVLRALKKNREERWPDMEAFLVGIKEGLGGGSSVSKDLLLSMTGEHDHRSGVHPLSSSGNNPLGVSSSGAIAAPVVPSAVAVTTSEIDVAVDVATPEPQRRTGLVLGFVAVVALLALGGGAFWALSSAPAAPPPPVSPALDPVTVPEAPAPGPAAALPTPAPEPTPSPEPPPIAHSVIVSLRSFPAGAIASLGDRELGPTPADVELTGADAEPGHELSIVFSLRGFRDTTVTATVEGERLEMEARLTRVPRTTTAGGTGTGTGTAGGGEESGRDVHVEGYRDSPY